MKALTLIIISLSIFSGCATVDSLHPGGGGASFEVRGKTYDEIWKATVRTAGQNLTIVESDKAAGILKAEKGVGIATWGEVVGVFIRPTTNNAETYIIEVQSLKRARGQFTGQDWTPTMISGIKAELGE